MCCHLSFAARQGGPHLGSGVQQLVSAMGCLQHQEQQQSKVHSCQPHDGVAVLSLTAAATKVTAQGSPKVTAWDEPCLERCDRCLAGSETASGWWAKRSELGAGPLLDQRQLAGELLRAPLVCLSCHPSVHCWSMPIQRQMQMPSLLPQEVEHCSCSEQFVLHAHACLSCQSAN